MEAVSQAAADSDRIRQQVDQAVHHRVKRQLPSRSSILLPLLKAPRRKAKHAQKAKVAGAVKRVSPPESVEATLAINSSSSNSNSRMDSSNQDPLRQRRTPRALQPKVIVRIISKTIAVVEVLAIEDEDEEVAVAVNNDSRALADLASSRTAKTPLLLLQLQVARTPHLALKVNPQRPQAAVVEEEEATAISEVENVVIVVVAILRAVVEEEAISNAVVSIEMPRQAKAGRKMLLPLARKWLHLRRLLLLRPVHGGSVRHAGAAARAMLREARCPVEVLAPR